MPRGSRPRGRDASGGATLPPLRTCVGCRTVRPRSELLRLVAVGPALTVDPAARLPGRGAYLCPCPECLQRAGAKDGAALRRALRVGDLEVAATLAALRAALPGPVDGPTSP
jgi:predicted RNA-binding protein YlxR (DUF448 family)